MDLHSEKSCEDLLRGDEVRDGGEEPGELREVQHAVADAVEQRRQTSAGDTGDTPVFRSSCAGCE